MPDTRAEPANDAFDGSVPPPDFVNIETTRFCNLRCRMCVPFNDGTTVAGPHMELDEFERIAKSVFPYVSRWQPTVSGEPTMSKGFDRMLALAGHFGVKAELFTNGTLLSDAMIERLAPNAATVTISFDGATPATFEMIREGAEFADVTAKVRRLIAYARATLPADWRPHFGLNCTLMERNIRELPELVTMAARDFGVDFMSCHHVFPVTPEMKRQSLVHHRELARASIDAAFARAQELGLPLLINALDQLTAANALEAGQQRAWSHKDGVVEGLEYREIFAERRRPWQKLDASHPDYTQIHARRMQAQIGSAFPAPRAPDPNAPERGSIWWCDFLWNKLYVNIGGDVQPCCVHASPVVGNLLREPFEQLWNNHELRAMRTRLVAKQPVPICRGCMHVREINDPVLVDQYLQGKRPPRPDELTALPKALDPTSEARHRSGPSPVLEWQGVPDARGYVVQFSLDRFASILFATDGPMGGPAVKESRYEIPKWAWRHAPVDYAIFWRVLAKTPRGEVQVGDGVLPPESDLPDPRATAALPHR